MSKTYGEITSDIICEWIKALGSSDKSIPVGIPEISDAYEKIYQIVYSNMHG